MRTRKVVFVFLLIAVGLQLIGCGGTPYVIVPGPGTTELVVQFIQPAPGNSGIQIRVTGNTSKDFNPLRVRFFYDIPEGVSEYLVAGWNSTGGNPDFYELHLRVSKNPSGTK